MIKLSAQMQMLLYEKHLALTGVQEKIQEPNLLDLYVGTQIPWEGKGLPRVCVCTRFSK